MADIKPVAWVSRNDAMFTDAGNWRCTNPLLYSSQESPSMIPLYTEPPSAPVGVEGLVERMRQAPSRLWRADLVGQQISVERMRDILAFALAQQPAACDMGELCIGCEPRNADGSCPDQQPAAVDGAVVERVASALDHWDGSDHDSDYYDELARVAVEAVFAAQPGGAE